MRKSIATVSLSGTLEEKLAAISRAGFDGVEIFENDLVSCPKRPAEIRRIAEDLGLRIDLYQPFRDFEAMPDELFARNMRRAEHKLDVMEQLGAPMMLVCSNVSPDAIDDDALAAHHLHTLAELAHDRGVHIAYEALAWGRHVSDYRRSYEIVAAADHPHLGVCLDSFHILSRGSDPAGIRDIPRKKIFFLQLADAPYLGMDVLQWSRHHRCFPGQGAFDLTTFLDHVVSAGYPGPLSLEIFNDVFRQADSRPTAVDAMRSLLFLEESLDQRLTSGAHESSPSHHPSVRERIELFTPPAPAELHGYAFTEFAVGTDDPDGGFEHSLRLLGFRQTGRHRSKSVSLWQHGDVNLVLNFEHPAEHGPKLIAAGLRTDDAPRAANRAEALLARTPSRRRGPGEADLPAIDGQDGMTFFFCSPGDNDGDSPVPGGRDAWLDDFVPVEPTEEPATHLLAIDHLTLPVPFDQFDEAVLYFRAVLGLEPAESVEVPGLYGLVRSRALVSADDGVRIVLNVPPLRSVATAGEATPGQHMAIRCDDIIAAARFLRGNGMPNLAISDNYYDDLAARWDVPDELVAELRAYGILYDREDPDGEFFHFYVPATGYGFLFEIVQRVGPYRGYGAANAPVRMASQRHAISA